MVINIDLQMVMILLLFRSLFWKSIQSPKLYVWHKNKFYKLYKQILSISRWILDSKGYSSKTYILAGLFSSIQIFTSENLCDILNFSSLNLIFSGSSSLYLMSSSLWSTSSMLSSFNKILAALSLSFVGDLFSAFCGSSGLDFLGLPIRVTELIAPGDDGDVPLRKNQKLLNHAKLPSKRERITIISSSLYGVIGQAMLSTEPTTAEE